MIAAFALRRLWGLLVTVALAGLATGCAAVSLDVPDPAVEAYRLAAVDGSTAVFQASGLHFGKVGRRHGLWIVCDRNSGPSANQVYFIDRRRLQAPEPGGTLCATEAIPLTAPPEGWERFAANRPSITAEIMAELQRQFENHATGQSPVLDLEGITIGRSLADPSQTDLFVAAEQPFNLVLQLRLVEERGTPRAVLVDCFLYREDPAERGGDTNDGLEGIAWSGRPGEFFLAEEGTRPFRPHDELHFFDHPRLLLGRLAENRVAVVEPWTARTTESVRAQHGPPSQTLNALTRWDERTLAAVDRNGGWILTVEVRTGQAKRWLSLYAHELLNLRERLAEFPGPRRMPYVSIEGIARDDAGDLWLVDDPAMPEPFRESCLIRVRRPPPGAP